MAYTFGSKEDFIFLAIPMRANFRGSHRSSLIMCPISFNI